MVITALLPAENKYKIRVSKYCESQKTMRGEDQPGRFSRLHRSPGSGLSGRTITVPLAGASSLHASLDGQPVPGTVRIRSIRSGMAANNSCGTITSANWNLTAEAWCTSLAPISDNLSRDVVRDQVPTDRG